VVGYLVFDFLFAIIAGIIVLWVIPWIYDLVLWTDNRATSRERQLSAAEKRRRLPRQSLLYASFWVIVFTVQFVMYSHSWSSLGILGITIPVGVFLYYSYNSTKFCDKCGAEYSDQRFCSEYGARLVPAKPPHDDNLLE
jgi:hypothetical protein